ncbi:MAG: hypothetical protein ACXIVQ_03735 [Acidimicrobiales bacterium]
MSIACVVAAAVFVFTSAAEGVYHPEEWDERVLELVEWVEQERELEFLHPVYVDFFTPEEYSDYMRYDAAELTEDDLLALDRSAGAYRALGLTSGPLDMFEASNEMADTGTLAVYSWFEQRIVVRGTEVDAALEVTLVHELVHALQDQHFDLGRIGSMESVDEAAAFRAVVEGDATMVEYRYLDSLPWNVRVDLDAPPLPDVGEAPHGGDLDFEFVPDAMVASSVAPYALGAPFVEIAWQLDGWDGVNRWLEEPPPATAVLLAPFRIDAEVRPSRLAVPEIASDDELIYEGDLGAASLLVMLSTRIDAADAMSAAEAWRSDRYLEVESDGRTCIVLAVEGVGERTATRIEDALREWAALGPVEADATVDRTRDTTTLRSCDPGEDARYPVSDPMDAIQRASARNWLAAELVAEGETLLVGICIADRVLEQFSLDDLMAAEASDGMLAALVGTLTLAGMSCAPVG